MSAGLVKIDDLGLSVRTYNCLVREGIRTVGALITRSEEDLLDIRNFGLRGVEEVTAALAALGLCLAVRSEKSASCYDRARSVLTSHTAWPSGVGVVHEQIDIYRFGQVKVTIHPDKRINISTSEFSDLEFDDLCTLVDRIREDRKDAEAGA